MPRAKALAAAILIVFYGAVGARQPAVRATLMLPVPAASVAAAVELPASNPATLLLHLTRVLYEAPTGKDAAANQRRESVRQALWAKADQRGEPVPLPLDPSIWRDTILQQKVDDRYLAAAILSDRRAALLYYGLSALDDETLAWLGPDRKALLHVRSHPGVFAAFGRSLHIRAGRVVVPGGTDAEPLWTSLVDEEPANATAFVQRLFRGDGRLAYFYDTLAHLDTGRLGFALGMHLPRTARTDRFRALFETFAHGASNWHVADHPFSRPPMDAAMMLAAVRVDDDGVPSGPRSRRLWERVFSGDETLDVGFSEIDGGDLPRADSTSVDAAWLASRIGRVPYSLGRRRLDVFLFGQRVFDNASAAEAATVASALRGVSAYPALMLSLERSGVTAPAAYVAAARTARALNGIRSDAERHHAVLLFQASLGILERAVRSGGLPDAAIASLTGSLTALADGPEDPAARVARWVTTDVVNAFARTPDDTGGGSAENRMLAAMAGVQANRRPAPTVEWEGLRYTVDPAAADVDRMRRIRAAQGGPSLDEALAAVRNATSSPSNPPVPHRALGDTLASILYAAHLGPSDTQAVMAGNVALRHDFGYAAHGGTSTPWKLPMEHFAPREGWHVRGALLGLDSALARLSMRRLDPAFMPPGPKLGTSDLQALMLTAAMLNPVLTSDAVRDEIAASLARGRARASALSADPAALDRAAIDAGLSEWRRQALAWTIATNRDHILEQFSPLELFWLGGPRASVLPGLDAWGTAAQPLSGCLCTEMPRARPSEEFGGRPTTGVLATRYADVALRLAEVLASLDMPAALMPGVFGFALQDVIDRASPAFPDDGLGFGRAAATLSPDLVSDYIAALTAGGPLVPSPAPKTER